MAAPAPQDLPNKKGKGKGTYKEFGGEKVYIPPESESEYESETDSNGDFVDKRTDKQKAKYKQCNFLKCNHTSTDCLLANVILDHC